VHEVAVEAARVAASEKKRVKEGEQPKKDKGDVEEQRDAVKKELLFGGIRGGELSSCLATRGCLKRRLKEAATRLAERGWYNAS